MITFSFLVNFVFFTQYVECRDFYMGYMYHPNTTLVAQDVIYKAAPPFGCATASYGRLFKCQISYFRVVDRLGIGRGPITKVVRGGIGKKFIAVRIRAAYRVPLSVNVYVACVKKQKPKPPVKHIITTTKSDKKKGDIASTTVADDKLTTASPASGGADSATTSSGAAGTGGNDNKDSTGGNDKKDSTGGKDSPKPDTTGDADKATTPGTGDNSTP